jgi:ribose-phosphate pyrophosphokinase
MLGVGYLFFIKERYATDKTRVVSQEGGCSGSIAIVIDDIIDTAGTAIQVSNILQTQGFKTIVGYFVHPVLSDDAVQRIIKSPFKQVYVSNTIPMQNSVSKIAVFDIVNAVCDFLTRHIA